MLLRELLAESWSEKYKRSINCASPKGFSQKAHCQGRKKEEDQHPNDAPLGPETKPTMPAGTVRVDVDDVYDWYKLGQHISNMKGLGKHDFGKGPPSTIFSFGSEEEEHKYIDALQKTGLTTTDIDPLDPNQPKGMPRQKVDPTFNVGEAKKRKRKIRHAAYGPGPYGLYGYDAGYSGAGGGDGGGVGENVTGVQTMPNINAQQVELSNKYYNALVQRAKEDGRTLDTRTLNFLKAKAQDAAAQKMQQTQPQKPNNFSSQGQHTQPQTLNNFPSQGSERKVAKDINQFENFADGRNPQDKGDAKRHGVPTKASVSTLRKVAKQGGRKGQLAHWMANMKAGKAKKNESLTEAVIHPSTMNALEDFLPFVMQLLKLDKLPKIKIHRTIETGDQPSFGGYNPEDGTIQLALKDRHPADILRTLAHELVHFKQDLDGKLNDRSGMTGSNEENEANTKAGIIMRHFNKRFPQYLE